MKKFIHFIFLIGSQSVGLSQSKQTASFAGLNRLDSLKAAFTNAKNDSIRILVLNNTGYYYEHLDVDSALKYYNAGLNLARERSYAWGEANLMTSLSSLMSQQGKFSEALELLFKSLKIAEENNIPYHLARAYRRLGGVYYDLENFPKAVENISKALQIDEEKNYKRSAAIDHLSLGDAFEKWNQLDSAAFHIDMSLKQKDLIKDQMEFIYMTTGNIAVKKKNYEQAAINYGKGLMYAQSNINLLIASQLCAEMAAMYIKLNRKDSAMVYASKGFDYGKEVSFKKGIILTANLLAELYDSTQPSLALQYYKIAASAKDSLFGVTNLQTIQNLVSREEEKQRELDEAQVVYRNKLKLYGLLTGLAVLLTIAFILYRNNRQKQKANVLLQQQKGKIETTLNELKSTQALLVQSEKMASLGELTAGIAHEIQNPLNFVNNFSEVNKEMLVELNEEIEKGNYDDAKSIAKDVIANEEKINHHGKRADAIVKGMLQHSMQTSGQKEPTDINALCDEYLRLSYHGFRAKDKNFNAAFKTGFDETIGKINIVPQDIGRVLLNLYNNAFYAVNEKAKRADDNYEPTVTVSTKKTNNKVELTVKDNGNGIPQNITDKIFQPFFTTKPTGEGTGLGLSLSYDIIIAHGGEIKVESKKGEGSVFFIELLIA